MQARQSKPCIGGSTSREREREREREVCVCVCVCVCVLFEFRQFAFFYSGNSSTYFKVLCRSLQKKKSDRTRCLAVSILEYNLGPEINGSEVGLQYLLEFEVGRASESVLAF